eukprot:SAG11_NODE_291_length_11180_cov_102.040155_12_plen_49_part_00
MIHSLMDDSFIKYGGMIINRYVIYHNKYNYLINNIFQKNNIDRLSISR